MAEEAGRLLGALQQAAASWSRGRTAGHAHPSDAHPSDARPSDARPSDARPSDARPTDHAPEACGFCPLCQAIARLGRARPEVVGHLADATAALVAAVAALSSDGETDGRADGRADRRADRKEPPGRRDDAGPGAPTSPWPPDHDRPRVEHIDVTD